MSDNNETNGDEIIVSPNNDEKKDASTNDPPANNKETTMKDGKLQLTVIKYDFGTAKLLPGGRLAPVPSQLADSKLGVIRSYLLKNGYLEKADRNKKFCTKSGIEVTDDITLDHYIQENAETPAADGENAESADGRPTKHNIYVLNKEREKNVLDTNIDTFVKKPVDLSNAARVEFASASTGAPLTSNFINSNWAADSGSSIVYPADMSEKEWGIVMRNTNLLAGQFLQNGPVQQIIKVPGQEDITRPVIDVVNVERAYYSAFALKPRRLPDYDITFTLTETAEKQMSDLNIEPTEHFFRIPRFHIKDASQIRVFETKGSLATTMAASSFAAHSIDLAVGGSAFGLTAAVKGGASWSKDEKSASSTFNDTDYMHVVYEFPRVELILNEETLELSDECKADIQCLRHKRNLGELHRFENRYGVFFTRSVHLGGKLVSIEESASVSGATLSEKSTMLKAAASASVSGYGAQAEFNWSHTENSGDQTTSTEKKVKHSMSWSADGGETTLCNNPPKWCSTVASFYNWRVMKQDDVINIYELIGKLPGYEDIPTLVQNILDMNTDPETLVGFSLHLQPNMDNRGKRELYFGQPEERHIALPHMDSTMIDPHSFLLHGKEFASDVVLKKKTGGGYRPYGTAFGVPMGTGQRNIWLGESNKASLQGIVYPRLKYGVKYPLQYLVKEGKGKDEIISLFTLQVGGDTSSNPFLYGEQDKAANIMVEFLGPENTQVKDNSMVVLQFSYVFKGTTIPHVSNFRCKDLDDSDDTEKPKIEELKKKMSLPSEPQEPSPPDFTWYERGTFDYSPDWLYPQYHQMASWEKTPEVKRRLKAFLKKLDDYKEEKKKYQAEKEEHDKKVHDILEKASGKSRQEYELLKVEWDQHQETMNRFVPFAEMTFQIDYCDEENKKYIVRLQKAAETVAAVAQKAKMDKLNKEAEDARENKFSAQLQAIKAAVEKAEKEKLQKRTAVMQSFLDKYSGQKWLSVEKPRLERVKRRLEATDQTKADKLGKAIKKKDDAIAMFIDYDLDLSYVDACGAFFENPFLADAMAKISI